MWSIPKMSQFKNKLIVESSYPEVLAELLFEDAEEAKKSITSAQKAFQTRASQLNSLADSLPSGKYKDALKKLATGVVESVKETGARVDSIDPKDSDAPDKTAAASESFAQQSKVVKQAIDVNLALMQYLAKQIIKSKLHQGVDKDVPMETILDEAELLDDAKKEMLTAIGSVKVKPPKPKGFLASIIDAAFGETEKVSKISAEFINNKDMLVNAALELTPVEIGKFAEAMVNYGKQDASAAKAIESATDKATDAAGSDKIGDAPSAGSDFDFAGSDSIRIEYEGEQVFFYGRPDNPDKAEQEWNKSLKSGAGLAYVLGEMGVEEFDPNKLMVTVSSEDAEGKPQSADIPFKDFSGPEAEKYKAAMDDKTVEDMEMNRDSEDGKDYSNYLFDKNKKPERLNLSRSEITQMATDVAGPAGAAVIARMLDAGGPFEKLGFNINESLKQKSLKFLFEEKLSAEDFAALMGGAAEEDEGAFEDVDANDLAGQLNDIFKEKNIDLEIDMAAPDWGAMSGKARRLTKLGFYIGSEYLHGGKPTPDTFNTLLGSIARDELEKEDLEDLVVDIGQFYQNQNGKGAGKLKDNPDFVKLFNTAADSNPEKYGKYKFGEDEVDAETQQTTIEDLEEKLTAQLKQANPDFANEDFATTMIMALSTYLQKEVDEIEIVEESRVLGSFLFEKYDFETIKKYMVDEMGDIGEEADEYGGQDNVIIAFLKAMAPGLEDDGIKVTGIPDQDKTIRAKRTDDGIVVQQSPEAEEALEKAGISIEESKQLSRIRKLAGIL
jgi:hypothetical protein